MHLSCWYLIQQSPRNPIGLSPTKEKTNELEQESNRKKQIVIFVEYRKCIDQKEINTLGSYERIIGLHCNERNNYSFFAEAIIATSTPVNIAIH